MTTLFNPDIGNLGSAATTVAPAADRSNVMQEDANRAQQQRDADSFNTFAKGVFDIAPVVNDIAAQRYIEKNLVGKDGESDVKNAGFVTEKVAQDKESIVTGERDIQRRFASEAVKSLSGLERARSQGLIGHDEMMVRAEQIRRREANRAPFWSEKINAAYRKTTGTSTGVASSLAASPWSKTPEENAMDKERELVAAYAAEFNTTLAQADKMRAEDAWNSRQLGRQVSNETDFSAWGQSQITTLRADISKVLLTQASPNGTFDPEVLPVLNQKLVQFELMGREQIGARLQELNNEGVLVSGEVVNKMYKDLQTEVATMKTYLNDQNATKFMQNVVANKDAKTKKYLYDAMPQVMTLQAGGMDPTRMFEMMLTSGERFRQMSLQNPAMNEAYNLMTDDQLAAKIFGGTVTTIAGPQADGTPFRPDYSSVRSTLAAMSPAETADLLAFAKDQGTFDQVIQAVKLDPKSIVTFRDNGQGNVPAETMNELFQASGQGIHTDLIVNAPLGDIPEYSIFVNDKGRVNVDGSQVSVRTKGELQDLYDTIKANPSVWEGKADSAGRYLQELFPARKFTVTGKETAVVGALNNLPATEQITNIKENTAQYVSTIEDTEAVSELINQRIMSMVPTMDNMKERMDLINLQNEVWQEWDKIANPVESKAWTGAAQ